MSATKNEGRGFSHRDRNQIRSKVKKLRTSSVRKLGLFSPEAGDPDRKAIDNCKGIGPVCVGYLSDFDLTDSPGRLLSVGQ